MPVGVDCAWQSRQPGQGIAGPGQSVYCWHDMYPYLRWMTILLTARRRPALGLRERAEIDFRVGLFDADMFGELNNARYLTFAELVRWDYSMRVGFVKMMRQKNWGLAVGGASLRYRRRIPLFRKFSVSAELVCHDGRWFYFLQEFHSRGRICASALIKVGATSKQGLVPATEVIDAFGETLSAEMPQWVSAWIEAEGQRPWPEN